MRLCGYTKGVVASRSGDKCKAVCLCGCCCYTNMGVERYWLAGMIGLPGKSVNCASATTS